MRRICALFAALAAAFLFLLAGCGPKETVTPAPSPSEVVTPTPTATPTSTPTPTPPPTPEPTEEPKELWGFPIDDTHDAFEVPTGGKLGTVLVTVEVGPAKYDGTLNTFSVWLKDDLATPIQQMEAEAYVFHWSNVVDANFDGYMDFGYMYSMGNQPNYWHYWIWNEEQGQFVQEPAFDLISEPQFDAETGVISGYARDSAASGIESFHRWEDGKLVCVREVEVCYPRNEWTEQDLVVRDRVNGELVEVYRKTFGPPEDNSPIYDEAVKWYDLNYHGEA